MRDFALLLATGAAPFIFTLCAAAATFSLKSNAFADGASMPAKHSYNAFGCTGQNVSPDLHWSGQPAGTKSLALTGFDPDAPGKGWWHWVMFNIPAGTHDLDEGAGAPRKINKLRTILGPSSAIPGAVRGTSDFKEQGYGGPCPPPGSGAHHYIFTVYALDVPSLRQAGPSTTGPELLNLIEGHVLGKATLTGLFERK